MQPAGPFGNALELLAISKFPGSAGCLHQHQSDVRRAALVRFARERAHHADVGSNSRYRAHEVMLLVTALAVQCKQSFGLTPHQEGVTHVQFVKRGSYFTGGYQLKEEFDLIFERAGDD